MLLVIRLSFLYFDILVFLLKSFKSIGVEGDYYEYFRIV
ncbi:hypothetical protein JOD02_000997 [Caldicoprobacter guelmensis]|nr:hypothetical protein [Caldicoprobacter guelmensis]